MGENMNLSAEDRAVLVELTQAVNNQNQLAQQIAAKKEKSWLSKAADWVEDHPVVVISAVCLTVAAAECYILSRQNNN